MAIKNEIIDELLKDKDPEAGFSCRRIDERA